jgi:ornithine cyclodeaminase/alanine dehydrogenase-like protein (mu-crystallin family)
VAARLEPGRVIDIVREALGAPREGAETRLAAAGLETQLVRDQHGLAALTIASTRLRDGAVLTRFGPDATPVCVFEADTLRRLAAGAACAVAAQLLAPGDGHAALIGAGALAESTLRCLAAAAPARPVTVYSRAAEQARRLAAAYGARTAASVAEATRGAALIVTTTRARDPVLRDDWLGDGMLVAALGATRPDQRELDYRTLARAVFVCCDHVEAARSSAADLTETISAGHLDWLEVHELAEAATGAVEGRARATDVIVYKGVGDARLVAALTAAL